MEKGNTVILSALLLFGVFALLSTAAEGAAPPVVAVDCSTQSLQTALNSNPAGTTFNITGTCNENVAIKQNGIILDGGGTATIHGPNTTDAATITLDASFATIRNLTITGGWAGVVVPFGTTVLSGNTFSGSANYGILAVEGGTAYILGNTITGQPKAGIAVIDNGTARIGFAHGWDVTPTPNTISNNGGHGILVERSSSARIAGNQISDNGGSGIFVSMVSHADISDNDISGNKVDGITVSGDSGLDLGKKSGTDMYSAPNRTNGQNKNVSAGVSCSMGGYVDGRRGTLTGTRGAIIVREGCISNALP